MEGLFDKIKKDVKKGFKEGIAAVVQGASVVSAKMSELTAEGKRQYKILALQLKIQTQMTELGGRTYDVLNKKQSPETDRKIKAAFAKIKKLEWQLNKIGGKRIKTAVSKKPAKKAKSKPKIISKKLAKKMATKAANNSAAKK